MSIQRTRNDHVAQIHRDVDDFLYIVAHDLKEPLRAVGDYCESLLEDYRGKLDEDGQRRLDALAGLSHRLQSMVGDLMSYCRAGGIRPNKTEIDVNIVVADVLETLRPTIAGRGASVDVVDRLPVVRGDAVLLGVALRNLITNGLKFNESPRPQVEVGCLPGNPATFFVRDNGIGIDPRHHEAVFAVFRRLHSRRQYEGTGVGLTIVQRIVRSHGGRIWLQSELGQGTTFFFTLAAVPRPTDPRLRSPHWRRRARARRRMRAPTLV